MSDIDTTPVAYTIRYACDHEFTATGVVEDLHSAETRFADGVLTVPCECADCLDLQPVDGVQIDDGWPWDDDVLPVEEYYLIP